MLQCLISQKCLKTTAAPDLINSMVRRLKNCGNLLLHKHSPAAPAARASRLQTRRLMSAAVSAPQTPWKCAASIDSRCCRCCHSCCSSCRCRCCCRCRNRLLLRHRVILWAGKRAGRACEGLPGPCQSKMPVGEKEWTPCVLGFHSSLEGESLKCHKMLQFWQYAMRFCLGQSSNSVQ